MENGLAKLTFGNALIVLALFALALQRQVREIRRRPSGRRRIESLAAVRL
jgi:hypothetical protein